MECHRDYPGEVELIINALSKQKPWDVLSHQQLRYFACNMSRVTVTGESRMVEEGTPHPPLVVISSGKVSILKTVSMKVLI